MEYQEMNCLIWIGREERVGLISFSWKGRKAKRIRKTSQTNVGLIEGRVGKNEANGANSKNDGWKETRRMSVKYSQIELMRLRAT